MFPCLHSAPQRATCVASKKEENEEEDEAEEIEEDEEEDEEDEEGEEEKEEDEDVDVVDDEEAEEEEKTYVMCTVILFHLVFLFYSSGSQVVHEPQPDTK